MLNKMLHENQKVFSSHPARRMCYTNAACGAITNKVILKFCLGKINIGETKLLIADTAAHMVASEPISPDITVASEPLSPDITVASEPLSPDITVASEPLSPDVTEPICLSPLAATKFLGFCYCKMHENKIKFSKVKENY